MKKMRKEVIDQLEEKIKELEETGKYKPDDIETGMSGSFIRFIYFIGIHKFMTEKEWEDDSYIEYLRIRYLQIFKYINKENVQ
jgi:hypothetical protein